MNKRNDQDLKITNDELARRLFQRQKYVSAPPKSAASRAPEALASRRDPAEAPQSWSLGKTPDSRLSSISERERRALFAALSKGTRANLGRDPTVAEFIRLVEEIDRARALVSSAQEAVQGRVSVHFDGERLAFRGSMQNLMLRRSNGRG